MSSFNARTKGEHALWLRNVDQYLRARAWVFETESSTPGLAVYSLSTSEGEAVAWVPVLHAGRDRQKLQAELMQLLERIERRPGAEIIEDITFVDRDRVLVRVVDDDTEDGTIAALAGQRVIDSALDAAVYSAWGLERHAPVLLGSMPKRVAEYQRSLRLGQTRRGSFVVSVYSPLRLQSESESSQLTMFKSQTGFPRDAIKRWLMQATVAAEIVGRSVSTEKQRLDAFVEAKISANLLEAMGNMSAASSEVEISAEFSPVAPEPNVSFERKIFVDGEQAASLQANAQMMRRRVPTMRTIVGHVTQLNRRSDAFGDKVEVAAQIDGKPVVVVTELYGEHYKLALRLIEARSPITLTGQLVRKGRWRLEELTEVAAYDEDELKRYEQWRRTQPLEALALTTDDNTDDDTIVETKK